MFRVLPTSDPAHMIVTMITKRNLLLMLVSLGGSAVASAQTPATMVNHVRDASFRIDVPKGWIADTDAASKSDLVFVLVPTGAIGKKSAPHMSCRYYKDMVQTVAMYRAKRAVPHMDPDAQFVELSLRDAGDARTIVEELRSKKFPPSATAYIPLGTDVLAISFGAPDAKTYKDGLNAFLDVLRSYKEAK